jgi:hypothetical protein
VKPIAGGWGDDGRITRVLFNVPPGAMKSLLVNVFFPAWEWGARGMPWLRYLSASYSEDLTVRDNRRCRAIIGSDLYQSLWGDVVQIDPNQGPDLCTEPALGRHGDR